MVVVDCYVFRLSVCDEADISAAETFRRLSALLTGMAQQWLNTIWVASHELALKWSFGKRYI